MGLMQKFKREIRSVNGKMLAFDLRNGMGATLGGLFEKIARGKVHDSEIREIYGVEDESEPGMARIQAGPQFMPSTKAGKFTALVSMRGVALYDLEYQPYCFSTSLLATVMDQLGNDPTVDTIVLSINTPGGHVTGTQEAADAVWAARKKKTVIGIVDPLCASAGYWIGSQCTKLIGVPSADIGSIGVFMTHYDCSAMMADSGIKPTFIYAGEHKVEGNAMEPLSADALAWFQSEVDDTYQQFLAAVARGRGISADKVLENFGKGRCYGAPMAKRVGMIDEIATLKQAYKGVGISLEMPQDTGRRRIEGDEPAQAEAKVTITGDAIVNGDITANEQRQAADLTAIDANLGEATAGGLQNNFLTEDGCGKVTFREVRSPGSVMVYAEEAWPVKVVVAGEMLRSKFPVSVFSVVGNTLTFAVANGAAVYTKIGETEDDCWVCTLEPNSSFTPPPAHESPEASGQSGRDNLRAAGAAIEAAADANRRAAEAARMRLAVLSA